MMGDIYGKATDVIVGVGPSSEDIKTILSFTRRHPQLLKKVASKVSDERPHLLEIMPLEGNLRLGFALKHGLRTSEMDQLLAAYCRFLERPYFSRLWILQELWCAKWTWLCCGDIVMPFDTLRPLDVLVHFWARERKRFFRRTINNKMYWRPKAVTNMGLLFRTWQREEYISDEDVTPSGRAMAAIVHQRHCLYLAFYTRWDHLSLANALKKFRGFQCADNRDQLYGILSLVDWSHATAPIPDYNKDSFDITIEVMSLLLKGSRRGNRSLSPTKYEWPSFLHELFGVTATNQLLREAIKSRLRPPDSSTESAPESDNIASDRLWGFRLQAYTPDRTTQDNGSLVLSLLQQEAHDKCVKIVDQHGRLFASAAPDTRVGDWYLLSYWEGFGLIIQVDGLAECLLKGLAITSGSRSSEMNHLFEGGANGQFKAYYMWWNPEDVVVLDWLLRNAGSNQDEMLRLRICGKVWSSHATRDVEKKVCLGYEEYGADDRTANTLAMRREAEYGHGLLRGVPPGFV
jgi:hypothetical protein